MARGKAHPPELKAAVLAALLTGQAVDAVATAYKLPRQTVLEWQRQARTVAEVVQTEKTAGLGDLLADYLRESLTTLAVQARVFRDEAWLKRQPASDAAVLHGVSVDKAIRLLEALDAGQRSAPDDAP
jgi:transposase-like protein